MSPNRILSTQTPRLLDLLGNGRVYRVPPFQRDYSWAKEQWEDLWNDLMGLRADRDSHHYMGALVMRSLSARESEIIDGQQRIATLSILALAVIHRLYQLSAQDIEPEANTARATELRRRFIGERDPASLLESTKLSLNETDNPFYQDYLVRLRFPQSRSGRQRSNRLMLECFEYFSGQLGAEAGLAGGGERLASFLSDTVALQLFFILITVDDEMSAYTVFETLNARGLELTVTDLLKNYLFALVRVRDERDVLQRRWRALITTAGQEHVPDFLRYHLLTQQPTVRHHRLFQVLRERIISPFDVFDLIDALENRADLFTALSDPTHAFWAELPAAKPWIRELNLFRVRQMTPLLFAAWERFSHGDFVRMLKLVAVISFRYTVVSALNPNALEPIYHQAAKAVLAGTARHPRDVFQILRTLYVDDAKFKQDFTSLALTTSGQRKKQVKYILGRLEADASGRDFDPDSDPATIEHILPENPATEWNETFPERHWDNSIYRLGNLALLEPAANRRIGNADYPTKRAEYERSNYITTRDIAELAPEEWTPALIEHRQRQLAERAVHLWRADFDT